MKPKAVEQVQAVLNGLTTVEGIAEIERIIEEVKLSSQKEPIRVEEVIDKASGKVCLPPCQIACPVGEDIQRTNVMIASLPLDTEKALAPILKIGDEIYERNPLFTICSYICGLCEKECNYRDQTGAIRRKTLKRFLTDYYLPYLETKPPLPPPTKEKVAVVGGGPGGLMCGYILSKRGYHVTILERSSQLGGALRYIPQYRLPTNIMDATLDNLVRIAHMEVKFGVEMGIGGKTLDELKNEGYRAVFIATGTPSPRPLTIERELVAGAELEGVMFGLHLLSDVSQGKVPPQLFRGKKVIVVGGGNVAFDVARSARRLGGDVGIVCLECEDKSSRDGIPADIEEIEGAREEGIRITYGRGVEAIIGRVGRFEKIKCPRCISVFDESGFNPKFDRSDCIYLEGDVLLVTIGQGPERAFSQQEGLLNERGRLDIDQLTLMSNRREGVFIGGDVRRVGFAAEAMRDGVIAAESIDRYLKGEDLKVGREKEYQKAAIPKHVDYKPQPELAWAPVEERLNFEPFEQGFTPEEAVKEARRCVYCGPCKSCKACVALELQPEIPEIKINEHICSACGICASICSYDAIKLVESEKGLVAVIDDLKCKRCGVCVAACPAEAIAIKDGLMETIAEVLAAPYGAIPSRGDELMTKGDVVIIGGSAAGIQAALTAQKQYALDKVIVIRREPKVLVPCGIPYIMGTLGSAEKNVMPDTLLEHAEFIIDEVTGIDRETQTVTTSQGKTIEYERLILATGSRPVGLPIPGVGLENVFTARKDLDYLKKLQDALGRASDVVIIGGGFIGAEFADECRKMGLNVTIIELLEHCLLLNCDEEFCIRIEDELRQAGVQLKTGHRVTLIGGNGKVEYVECDNGERFRADVVILSIGVTPNNELAKKAGLEIGQRGGILVDQYMKTSDLNIFAIGDCAEKFCFFTGQPTSIRLASVATREARIAAANLFQLRRRKNQGTIGVFSTMIGGTAIGVAGLTERAAREAGFDIVVAEAVAADKHPGAMPNARDLYVKLIFESKMGKIIGGQACGGATVGEIANVIGVTIANAMTVDQIVSLQVGTHPALTASPIVYQIVNAAENAALEVAQRRMRQVAPSEVTFTLAKASIH